MIPRPDIASWAHDHPWPSGDQVEQDLLIAQAMVEISNDALLGETLALRGGTALHKLFLPSPYRYSEDLDYVRLTAGGIGETMRSLTDLGRRLGYDVRTQMGAFPKVFLRYETASGTRARIKIEMDTRERESALGLVERGISLDTRWFDGSASIVTYRLEELLATKTRALYERRKGRDLFDLWLSLREFDIDPHLYATAFELYRPKGVDREKLAENLWAKTESADYCADCDLLIRGGAESVGFRAREAAALVESELLSRI